MTFAINSHVLLLKVLDNAIEAEKVIQRYEALASDLLEWIERTIGIISNQKFANSLTGVQQQLQAFTTYCTIEKPIKYAEHQGIGFSAALFLLSNIIVNILLIPQQMLTIITRILIYQPELVY